MFLGEVTDKQPGSRSVGWRPILTITAAMWMEGGLWGGVGGADTTRCGRRGNRLVSTARQMQMGKTGRPFPVHSSNHRNLHLPSYNQHRTPSLGNDNDDM